MSVHVTNHTPVQNITKSKVVLKLTDNTSINAFLIEAWELIDLEVNLLHSHYENTINNTWIDEETIVNVSFPECDSSTHETWFTDNTQLYYWQDGRFYYADGRVYEGDHSNFSPVTTTVTNNITDNWTFNLVYEVSIVDSNFVYAPITRALKITSTGILIVRYWRGSVEIFPELVEETLPASIYKSDCVKVRSGERFDSRTYPKIIAGCALSHRHRSKRKNKQGQWTPGGQTSITWYETTAIDSSVRLTQTWNRTFEVQWNAEGGAESIEKDFMVEASGGSEVEIFIRTLHYPIVLKQIPTSGTDEETIRLLDQAIAANTSSTAL